MRGGGASRSDNLGKYVIFLLTAILLNTGSNILYKFSSLSANRATSAILMASGLLLGVANVLLYTLSIRGNKLSVAYPIFSAGSLIAVFLSSFTLFKETVAAKDMLGVVAIAVGIAMIA